MHTLTQHTRIQRGGTACRGATAFPLLFCGWCATWVVLFVRCVVSTVVVSWYWAREGDREKRLAEMSTWRAFRRVALCHAAGSLALLAFWMPALIAPRMAVGACCKFAASSGRKRRRTPCSSPTAPPRCAPESRCTGVRCGARALALPEDAQQRDRSEVRARRRAA